MKGHITLDGDPFIIVPTSYQESPANPFSASLGTGAGDYDDLKDYSAWLMDDWRSGVGVLPDEGGGFLWGTCETRFKQKLMLPQLIYPVAAVHVDDPRAPFTWPTTITQTVSLTPTSEPDGLRIDFDPAQVGSDNDPFFWYFRADVGTVLHFEVVNTAGVVYQEYDLTVTDPQPVYRWYYIPTETVASPPLGTAYSYLSVEVLSGAATFPVGPARNSRKLRQRFGLTWVTMTDLQPFWMDSSMGIAGLDVPSAAQSTKPLPYIGRLLDNTWVVCTTEARSIPLQLVAGEWVGGGGLGSIDVTYANHATTFNQHLYIATDDSVTRTNNGVGYTDVILGAGSADFTTVYRWNNILYAATENKVWYTADGSSWAGGIAVCSTDYTINGMAGLGASNDIYCACDDGLYRFAEGDVSFGVFPFGTVDPSNGKGTVNYQGDIYIPADGTVYRYSQNGTILDVGISKEEDLPREKIGEVVALAVAGSWLLASVAPTDPTGSPTIWAYNSEGWHHIATLPPGMGAGAMFADRANSILWIGTGTERLFYLTWANNGQNPLYVEGSRYEFNGWLETDWFYGGLREIDKDWESVYITGEDISEDQPVDIFWQDDNSTEWELLGTVTATRQEIIWDNDATRPNSKQLKLALRLRTNDPSSTPVVRAVRVKYHNMITDRKRFNFTVRAANDLRGLDGEVSDLTIQEWEDLIETLITKVPPIVIEDIDGEEHRVKVEQAYKSLTKVENTGEDPLLVERLWAMTMVEI